MWPKIKAERRETLASVDWYCSDLIFYFYLLTYLFFLVSTVSIKREN